ncbi:MAG: protein kinase, partial [Nocardioides sp.]
MDLGRGDRASGAAVDPLVGRVLDGRYHLSARIARGGMASVYEATDTRLDRVVAVKIMHAGLGDDAAFAERFVREARTAARVAHPNIVGIFDQGEDAGIVYLVMEYVPGLTLRDVIRAEAPMPPDQALEIMEPILAALAAAHEAGLVHRDIKPENVLFADDGRIKVADFGLAKAVSAETQHSVSGGVLIGSVSYLAPELVTHNRADARADIYALGILLYELLTGRKPHEGDTPIQVAYKHVHEDVPPPSALVPSLPPIVDALVSRASARDRDRRPADAGVLLLQVRRVRQALRAGLGPAVDAGADELTIHLAGHTAPDSSGTTTLRSPSEPPAAPRVAPQP